MRFIMSLVCLCAVSAVCDAQPSLQSLDLKGFRAVEIAAIAQVEILQGGSFSVEIQAQEIVLESLTASVEKGVLVIERPEEDFWAWIWSGAKNPVIQLNVVMPELTRLHVSGAADVTLEGFSGAQLDIDVAGAAEVSLNGAFDALRCKLAGAGELTLIGGGDQLVLDLAGVAKIHAEHYMANHVIIDGAGAIDATVHAQKWLDVDLAGAGKVHYAGRPEQIVEEISGAAELHKLP